MCNGNIGDNANRERGMDCHAAGKSKHIGHSLDGAQDFSCVNMCVAVINWR